MIDNFISVSESERRQYSPALTAAARLYAMDMKYTSISGGMGTVCSILTFVYCKRSRVLCRHCGVKQISAPFERRNSRFTLLFEGYAMLMLAR